MIFVPNKIFFVNRITAIDYHITVKEHSPDLAAEICTSHDFSLKRLVENRGKYMFYLLEMALHSVTVILYDCGSKTLEIEKMESSVRVIK